GLAAGVPLGWLGVKGWEHLQRSLSSARSVEAPGASVALGMPGPFPGRVIEARHPHAVNDAHQISKLAVRAMMDRGMCALTGADDAPSAWRRLFEPSDVVGIKVNPVGRKGNAPAGKAVVESISSFPVLREVVRNLKDIGVPARNIILFERYAQE